jgi:hypothetical protein
MLTLGVELRVKMNYKLLNIKQIGGGNAIDNQLRFGVGIGSIDVGMGVFGSVTAKVG